MAQSLAQIMQGLAGQYDPQAALIQKQQDALPGQETAAVAGLDAAKTNAFRGIDAQANARGMMYSGAPINEQSTYVGANYLPELARVKQNTQQQGQQLQNALLGVRQQQGQQAQGIYADQLNRDQQERQFQQQLAAQRDQAAASQRAQAAQGLSLAGMMGGGRQQRQAPSIDPMSAATGYAKTIKQQLLSAGNIQPYAREQVIKDITQQFGLSAAQASQIVYKGVFPDNWAGGTANNASRYVAAPNSSNMVASKVGSQLGYGRF